MNAIKTSLIWLLISLVGASAIGGIALHRGESINALWFITAALCVYAIAYRFYARWLSTRVFVLDETRATPAERLDNGSDFTPTHRWIVFGHHFAAIAGPGPLIGPTLAAQFGYLPGTLWIIFGAVLGGCVQDMAILFLSTRRNGKSLGQMARDELGLLGGSAALIATFAIMIILISVLGLVVVNAMKHSPWGTFTVAATIPIALLVGVYMRYLRPGHVLEASALGVGLLLCAVAAGGFVDSHPTLHKWFDQDGLTLAWCIMGYGFAAAIMPVWMLLAPRDYLSTYMKIGTISLLAIAIVLLQPDIKMPALTPFIEGNGPIFGGKLFPFVFITIACGAISGFHALISSGTTPKLISNERYIPLIGYGSMLLESFVAIMAMIAATVLEPGVFFAINSSAGVVGSDALAATAKITAWGYPVTALQMQSLAQQMGEATLFARTGGAPSLAVGMASIFGSAFGQGMLAMWYHFAIMFEAIFILTTLDAGTRVGRFMLQDMLGNLWPKMAETSWLPSVILSSAVVVAGWGYFLYIGVIDPNGGVNILWPLFGIANQMLAAIALAIATGILVKSKQLKFSWVTAVPLLWLVIITTTTAWQKLVSPDVRIGFLAAAEQLSLQLNQHLLSPEKASVAPQLIINLNVDAVITFIFTSLMWLIVLDMLHTCYRYLTNQPTSPLSEAPHEVSLLNAEWVRD